MQQEYYQYSGLRPLYSVLRVPSYVVGLQTIWITCVREGASWRAFVRYSLYSECVCIYTHLDVFPGDDAAVRLRANFGGTSDK